MMNLQNKNLDELIMQAQRGKVDAFEVVFDRLFDKIYRYIAAKVPVEVAEDLAEETFFQVWKNVKKYRKKPNCVFSSWVYRIAHNLVVDYYRKNQSIEELPFDLADQDVLNQPQSLILWRQKISQLEYLTSLLSENMRQVVLLKFIKGLTYSEIARKMKKSEGSIRVMIHRALTQLKDIIRSDA